MFDRHKGASVALVLACSAIYAADLPVVAQPSAASQSSDFISGTVTSEKGPEAGVWVIAETKDFPTKFVKIVVTDDKGKYLIPQMPGATYDVFVRGYGLVDSKRVKAKPGRTLDLRAVVAPNQKAAAQYYPAAWWLAMLKFPEGADNQKEYALTVKECHDCHQVGDLATRLIPPQIAQGSTSSLDMWDKRTAIGPASGSMGPFFATLGEGRKAFADWTDDIAKGATPQQTPPRPSGVERNVVISEWDWGEVRWGRMDMEASNPLNPRVNANGPVYGVSEMTDGLVTVDPIKNTMEHIHVPSPAPPNDNAFNANRTSDPWFGPDVWVRSADPRSTLILPDGRVLVTDRVRKDPGKQPDFCTSANNPYGKYFPLKRGAKQLAIYDPKKKSWEFIDTCFSSDHNVIDNNNFIYFGQNDAIGWVDLDTWNKTHDAEKSQGWCPAVVDTNGDGKITPGWTEPSEAVDGSKDHRISFGAYSVTWNKKDGGSIWASGIGRGDRKLMRLIKGTKPPMTCRAEVFVPKDDQVFGSGGATASPDGLVWQNWRVSGHFTSFDRSRCGAESKDSTGKDCPQGWTIYNNTAEPRYANTPYKADESYLAEVDEHNTLGLGAAPLYFQTNTDSIEILRPDTKKFVTLRVPYPMGFYQRSTNGRIDDPKAGWKGKGLWTTYSSYAGWHIEGQGYPNTDAPGGVGTLSKAVKFQMRPNPLAH